MYTVVLATVLSAGTAAPDLGFHFSGCHGCHGSCYGSCWGCSGYCYGYGCGGCSGWNCCGGWSCNGCSGFYAAYAYPSYYSCSGCCGCFGYTSSCFGCTGCFGGGCYGWYTGYSGYGCYGCSGCCGCFGGVAAIPTVSHSGYGYGGAVAYATPPIVTAPAAPAASAAPASSAPPMAPADDKGGLERLPLPREGETRFQAPARVTVKAPLDVNVKVNGQLTSRRTQEEEFLTPELRPGYTYSYQFQAEAVRDGKPVTRTQRVMVRAGQRTQVDFSDLEVVSTPSTARVTVVLPAGARFFVDGMATPVAGERSSFQTPALEQGKTYHYNLEARVTHGSRSEVVKQKVTVQAGKAVTVDFVEKVNARLTRR